MKDKHRYLRKHRCKHRYRHLCK